MKSHFGECIRVSIVQVDGSGPACIGELSRARRAGGGSFRDDED